MPTKISLIPGNKKYSKIPWFADLVDKNARKQKRGFRKMHDLKLAFSEFYLSVILLQNFQNLNFTGFRKILKKHDKVNVATVPLFFIFMSVLSLLFFFFSCYTRIGARYGVRKMWTRHRSTPIKTSIISSSKPK